MSLYFALQLRYFWGKKKKKEKIYEKYHLVQQYYTCHTVFTFEYELHCLGFTFYIL